MAYTYYNFTEGSGRKARSFQRTDGGANTVDEMAYVESEPPLLTYTVSSITAISIATANSHLLEIMAGASLHVWLRRLRVTQVAVANAAQICTFALYRLTTAGTGGTAITPQKSDPSDAAAGATAMTLASAKGTEGSLLWAEARSLWSAVPTATNDVTLDWTFTTPRTKGIRVASGTSNGVALKNITAITTTPTVIVTAEICESDWF